MRRDMLRAALAALLLVHYACGGEVSLGPRFTLEPAAEAYGRVRCAAVGEPPPQLAWLDADNNELPDAPPHRRVFSNGTLELVASSEHAAVAVLRCRASNAHGTALSRDVALHPAAEERWEAVLTARGAAAGGVAALTCRARPPSVPAAAHLWYRGDVLIHIDAPTSESKYVVAGEAGDTLLIRGAGARDAGPYACVARHRLSAATRRSRPALLAVTDEATSSAPRLAGAGAAAVAVAAGASFCLPCASADHPQPHYTWYREWQGRLHAVEGGTAGAGGAWLWEGGAALCARAAPPLSGAWLCKAYNAFGDATLQVRLDVADALTVTVTPSVVVADAGSTVRLDCAASARGAALAWLHDGAAAGRGASLELRNVTRASRGVYQCFARTRTQHAQATAELRLGDSAPELRYTFIEQALRAGDAVSLRCAASGAPQPALAWLRDYQPLDPHRAHHRYLIESETSARGDVVSTLNVTAAAVEDGGRYTCRAFNRLGQAEHSARLNVYGPAWIRAVGPLRVVAGDNATVYCPYAGYPISSVSWRRRGGAGGAVGGAGGRVAARGAALRLAPALPADAGLYACTATPPHGAPATRDIEIQVRNPPKISPFMFSSELTEGSSVQVLCGVSSGDKPVYFSWLKDGAPLPAALQIEEKNLNEFSLLMFSELSARHSGAYTCRVSNHAAAVNYTAALSVKVAPAWTTEPLDVAVLLGAPVLLQCAARGHPAPEVTWHRHIGAGGLGSESEQWERVGGAWGGATNSLEESRPTPEGARALTVPAASGRHRGRYRCTADNGVGPALLKHVNLTVHEPARFDGAAGNVSCVRGQSASLVCRAAGDAPLAVTWSHRGTGLDLDSYRWTVSEVRTGDRLESKLQLRAAERGDAGEYRCHAHNQHGRSEVAMYLRVEEPPGAPRGVRLAGRGARWLRLRWRGAASARHAALGTRLAPDPTTYTFNLTLEYTPDQRSDADGLRDLVAKLEGLRPATAYTLRLVAANHVGRSPNSEPLTFTTLEEAPSAPPRNVRVRPAGPGELHVSWSAPPQDAWNGELLGYVGTWRSLGEPPARAQAGRATAPGRGSTELAAEGLRGGVRYALHLRAFNRAGAGPPSPTVYATAPDEVPEVPPEAVSCEAVSGRALRVTWAQSPYDIRGYDVHYAPLQLSWTAGESVEPQSLRVSAAGSASLGGLAPATRYSVWVSARAGAGAAPGPPSAPARCATAAEGAPGAVRAVCALPAAPDTLRVTWLAPASRATLTHYTLYVRELGKAGAGGEVSQRVEASDEEEEVWREVRGLRAAVYAVRVAAEARSGVGPASSPVTAAPAEPGAARVSSFGRTVVAVRGARVRLRCAAVGAPPLRRLWSPRPPHHTVTDAGDLVIHKVETALAGNYTCSVRNAGGVDSAAFVLRVLAPPAAPAPRLARAEPHTLHLAWDAPADNGAPILGYTVHWSREGAEADTESGGAAALGAASGSGRAAGGALALRRLACGAAYRVRLQAHNAVGASPLSPPLRARTQGDKSRAAPGEEFVWANSSVLRLNLLAWRARCAVSAWRLAVRPAPQPAPHPAAAAPWMPLLTDDGESGQADGLRPGTWYEIRVVASSPAGDTVALYRAPTLTLGGERIGEAEVVPMETLSVRPELTGAGGARDGGWSAGSVAPALLGGGLAALLAATVGLVLVGRCVIRGVRRDRPAPRALHPQLYSTEPGHKNEKVLTPPGGTDVVEISPYATFSMSGGGEGADACSRAGAPGDGGCALHLRTFSAPLEPAALPPRPNLLAHPEYGHAHDNDSESSGSPCAACAQPLYRSPLPPPGTLPRAWRECGGGVMETQAAAYARVRPEPTRPRRTPHPSTVRYSCPVASLASRPDPL